MRLFVVLLAMLGASHCFSQTGSDSLAVVADTNVHSPKKAVILSAVLPGAGQIYNHLAMPKGKKKAFWKVPLIYGGLGATGYFFVKNQSLMSDLRKEYNFRIDNDAINNFPEYDSDGLLTVYVEKRTTRDLCIIGFGLIYLLNVVDAGVEAHFVNFDISEDLSMHISPVLLSMNTPGINLRFNFHSNSPQVNRNAIFTRP